MPSNGNDHARERFDELRRRLTDRGASALSDEQLVTLLLGSGVGGAAADEVSAELVCSGGGIAGLGELSHRELCGIRGVGPVKAASIQVALELGRRMLAGAAPGARLACSSEVYDAMWPVLAGEMSEVFCCAMVDAKLRFVRAETISRGTLTASIVHPREAFRPAVRWAASGVIFVHNHPSGDPYPSDEDGRITARLQEAGSILGIPMLDHLILGTGGAYYSFADSGRLESRDGGYRGMVLRCRTEVGV